MRSLEQERARQWGLLLLALLALLALEVALVPPSGEFPVIDDWSYARIARRLAETGRFAYTGWNQMMLVTQAGLGALVIKLFGFSFTSLRWLVIGLGIVASITLYGCGQEMGLGPRAAGLVTLALAVCPLYLYSAYSFMTEIPFQAFSLAALWAYLRFFKTESRAALGAATLLSFLAFLLRQPAMLLPVGAMLCAGWARRSAPVPAIRGSAFWVASLGCLATMGLALAWRTSMAHNGDQASLPSAYLASGPAGLLPYLVTVAWRLFCSLQYQGLYSLPVTAALAGPALRAARRSPRLAILCAATVVGLTGLVYVLGRSLTDAGRAMPYLEDLLNERPYGTNGNLLPGTGPRLLGRSGHVLLTAASLPGGALLLLSAFQFLLSERRQQTGDRGAALREQRPIGSDRGARLVFFQWALHSVFTAAVYTQAIERYYLALLPLALMLVAHTLTVPEGRLADSQQATDPLRRPSDDEERESAQERKRGRVEDGEGDDRSLASEARSRPSPSPFSSPVPPAVAAFAVLATASLAFSLANLHDFFALHREVAAAVADLRARGIPTDRIDAGFAWVGWFYPGPVELLSSPPADLPPEVGHRSWYLRALFTHACDDYVVSLSRESTRSVMGSRTYGAWLPPPSRQRIIWILGPRRPVAQGRTRRSS